MAVARAFTDSLCFSDRFMNAAKRLRQIDVLTEPRC
jgi:hypothetical protein